MLRVISSAWKPHWDYGGRPLVAMSSCLLRFSVWWEPRLGNLDAKRSTICHRWVPASMLEHKVQEKGEKCIHVHRNFAEVDWVVLSYVCFSIRMASLGSGPSFSGGRNEWFTPISSTYFHLVYWVFCTVSFTPILSTPILSTPISSTFAFQYIQHICCQNRENEWWQNAHYILKPIHLLIP